MKLRTFVMAAITLTLGFTAVTEVQAQTISYYPPERIHCTLNNLNSLSCSPVNRNYLAEDVTNANLETGKKSTFYFATAVAYVMPSLEQSRIFFTYQNNRLKMVKLKSVNASIKPDLSKGSWKKFTDDIYTCDAGYMNCPITGL